MTAAFSQLLPTADRLVDLVLAVVALEALVLFALRRVTGHGPAPLPLLANLVAGTCLLLAMRAALTADGWPVIALWLAAAGAAHCVDLRLRWTRARDRLPVRARRHPA